MRALAALAVALFHFHGETARLSAALPSVVRVVVAHGYLGVDVFFVLSGFVIARSLQGAHWTPGFLGRFVLRRSVRLDPPYWVTIALAAAALSMHGDADRSRVTLANLAAHAAYLQNLLGYPNLIDVFWTLCIEIQLYLAFCLLDWSVETRSEPLRSAVFAATVIASLALPLAHPPERWNAVFVTWWYQFGLGALVCRASSRSWGVGVWLGVALVLTTLRAVQLGDTGPAVCAATAVLLVAAPAGQGLARVLGVTPLVWLGRRSYSFYLLHALIGVGLLRRYARFVHPSAVGEAVGVACALAVSVLAAEALYRFVEHPCMEWSRSLRGAPTVPVAASSTVAKLT